jgi:proteasome lid subunit RPN8/RPN11
LNKRILQDIKEYARLYPGQETCGLVVREGEGLSFVRCDNEHPRPESAFLMSAQNFLYYENVEYIYHSHPNSSSAPSDLDRDYSDELMMPFLIYSLPDDNFTLYKNKSVYSDWV